MLKRLKKSKSETKKSGPAIKVLNKGKIPLKPKANNNKEIGGPKGLEPTRYGDWEVNGRCSDF